MAIVNSWLKLSAGANKTNEKGEPSAGGALVIWVGPSPSEGAIVAMRVKPRQAVRAKKRTVSYYIARGNEHIPFKKLIHDDSAVHWKAGMKQIHRKFLPVPENSHTMLPIPRFHTDEQVKNRRHRGTASCAWDLWRSRRSSWDQLVSWGWLKLEAHSNVQIAPPNTSKHKPSCEISGLNWNRLPSWKWGGVGPKSNSLVAVSLSANVKFEKTMNLPSGKLTALWKITIFNG